MGPRLVRCSASRSHPLRAQPDLVAVRPALNEPGARMSTKYVLMTALISLATTVAFEQYKARKG